MFSACSEGVSPDTAPMIDVVLTEGRYSMHAALVNRGQETYTIVLPGDGSVDHMRTPCIGWSVIQRSPDTGAEGGMFGRSHPLETPRIRRLRCGNINALRPEEVVVLAPGDSCDLGAWIEPHLIQPDTSGTFEVVFYYENRPQMEWTGAPLGPHDPAAMKAVRGSTPLKARSNPVTVTF
ncbi:MAG: hypothetical protein RRA94_06975 [Bacteroidota bacterium]|nr:hypothetical protein [Bacteroidota bacterium]